MARRLRTLIPLQNAQVILAGETYLPGQVFFDLVDRIVVLRDHRLGDLDITDETLHLRYLDTDVPSIIRSAQKDSGWESMTVRDLLDIAILQHNKE